MIESSVSASIDRAFKRLRHYGLHTLDLSGIQLSSDHSSDNTIAQHLLREDGVKHLRLRSCGMTWRELRVITPAFSFLTTLDLSGNHLGSAGAAALAEAVSNTPRLERLNLWKNELIGLSVDRSNIKGRADLQGFTALVHALGSCLNLEIIDLSCNYLAGFPINSSHLQHPSYDYECESCILLQFLFQHPTLKSINLLGNGFRSESVLLIFQDNVLKGKVIATRLYPCILF
jgi:hypothetical protein